MSAVAIERLIAPEFANRPAPPLRTVQLGMSWFTEQPGGLDRYFAGLLKHLPAAGVDVTGFVVGTEKVAVDSDHAAVAVAPPTAKIWTRAAAFRRAVSAEIQTGRVNLVVSHHALYTLPVLPLLKDVPLVVHFHGPYAAECSAENSRRLQNRLKLWMERTVYGRATRCITLSKAFADILHDDYDVPYEKISVVPGAVETDRFDPPLSRQEARQKLGWPLGRPIVLSVRRLFRRMGLENLVESVKSVREKIPNVLVLIAGKGWMKDELAKQIADNNLQDNVRLLGFVPDKDLPLAYRAADLTVVPTVSLEGFGLITVESLSAGTPAIVTPVGGSPEVVGGLSADLVVPDWTPAALSAAITAALDGTLKLPTATQCQSFARRYYDWTTISAAVAEVYRQAIELHRVEGL